MSENTLPAEPAADATQQQLLQLFDFNPGKRTELAPDIFSISGFPHYEDVLSNWYAFFFRTEEVHGFGRLFTQALLELIAEKSAEPLPEGFMGGRVHCRREQKTKKGNYIDLVLYDEENEPNTFNQSVLIENKVYHFLHNDLDDYYTSIHTALGQKRAVFMTLWPFTENLPEQYVNITHKEFIKKVLELMPAYWAEAGEKHLIYLKDIDQNIQRLTSEMKMNENVLFYFKNVEKFRKLMEVSDEAAGFVYGQIRTAAEILEMKLYGKEQDWRNIWEHREIYYTIWLGDFLQDATTLCVDIELDGEAAKQVHKLREACASGGISLPENVTQNTGGNYVTLLSNEYKVKPEDIAELGTLLAEWIRRDLEDIRKAVTDVYTKQLNPSA